MSPLVPPVRLWAALTAAAALLVLASVPAGAAASATPRVVGGTTAPTPGWITQVWVEDATGEGLCGGELVSQRWVLTAAHCVRGGLGLPVAASAVHLRIGVPTLTPPTDADPGTGVDQVRINPDNQGGSTTGDAALLHLASPASALPVAIGEQGQAAVGAAASVLGWGVTGSGGTSSTLQQVAQTVIDPNRCTPYGVDFRADSMICAGGVQGQDSCNGDSGGPLALDATGLTPTLLGTVDFGSDACGDGTPAVYQRLTEGPTAGWLRTVLVRPSITTATTSPVAGATSTFTAASGWGDAVFSWDLDGDGAFDDATGASATTRLGTATRTVSVLARSASAGDAAITRLPVTPVDPTVTVSGPRSVVEGEAFAITLVSKGAPGTVTASGAGLASARSVAVAAGGTATLDLRAKDDRAWTAPRTVTIRLQGSGGVQPAPATLAVRVTDDDRPMLTGVRVSATGTGVTARAKLPGRGTLKVTAVAAGRTLATRSVTATGARTVAVRLALTAAQRAARPEIRLRWTSSDVRTVSASSSRRLR